MIHNVQMFPQAIVNARIEVCLKPVPTYLYRKLSTWNGKSLWILPYLFVALTEKEGSIVTRS